jgi:diacylglycerol kinase family enzyme
MPDTSPATATDGPARALAPDIAPDDAPDGAPNGAPSVALVLNARSGALLGQAGDGTTLEDRLRARVARLVVIPADAGTLPERVALAAAAGCDRVVVAGGDGSACCAAQALAGTGTALGLIPCGTMDLLARDLGLDPADHEACLRVLTAGTPRAIDAGEVRDGDGAAHLFLCASMLGTPARLTRHREAVRATGGGLRGWAGFALAGLRAMGRNRSMRLVLRCDGQVRRVRTPALTIAVNALDDATGRLFGRSCLDGGQLAIYLVHRASAIAQVWLLLRTALTGSLRSPRIETILTDRLEIEGPRRGLHVLLDGELHLMGPRLRYGVRPAALRVMAPPR